MLGAQFEKLPVLFLETYQRQLLAWAADLQKVGPLIELDLLTAPGASVIDMTCIPQKVALACDVLKHPISGEVRFLIRPASEMSAEVIAKHVEQLPRILQLRRIAMAQKARSQGHVDAVFEEIAEEFVQAYGAELRVWGFKFKQVGREYTIPLRKVPGAPVDHDEDGREVIYGVALVAEIDRLSEDRVRLLIRPKDEMARERIAQHVRDIRRHGQPMPLSAVH